MAGETTCIRTSEEDTKKNSAKKLFPEGARWISDASCTVESPNSPVPMYFRRRFSAAEPIAHLTVTATAMGIFDLYIDGKRLSEEYFNPGFTDYKANLQAVSFTAENLSAGEHVFLAVIAGGWAVGRSSKIANTNKSRSKLWADRQALLAALEITYTDDSKEWIVSDEKFEVTEDGPWTFADFYDGESYDAQKEAPASYNPLWRKASVEKLRISPRIRLRYGLPVTAHEQFEAAFIGTSPPGEALYDFGQNFAGVVTFEAEAHAGQQIIIRHAEMLDRGELYVKNLRTAKQILTYTCREGKQSWSPRFTYMGFRYIGVRIVDDAEETNCDSDSIPGKPPVPAPKTSSSALSSLTIRAHAIYSDLPVTGSFRCSDEALNRLQQNLVRSGKSNFVDIPT
ncbi:MAG: family 78 glycoside hydrolase catalytic domain, partial [Lachnospiraceae bacterium]|nr:family 78 glycoside hydrolase catalytic domain [Lachnospiraceae bacterium]